mgnify:CR=1 FL=1
MTTQRARPGLLGGAIAAAGLALAPAGSAQAPGAPMDEGPLDVSADDLQVFEAEGRAVYSGDVNAVRGGARLRADQVTVFFDDSEGGRFDAVNRLIAEGQVYYVTASEVAHGERGVYDVEADTITLTGDVVLTQGCNVSTGSRLVADLTTGVSRLDGDGGEGGDGRVRSVFFSEDGEGETPRECPRPDVPGDPPRDFDER